jgi:hypothetical protein
VIQRTGRLTIRAVRETNRLPRISLYTAPAFVHTVMVRAGSGSADGLPIPRKTAVGTSIARASRRFAAAALLFPHSN